jgi:hypothetical protein
MSRAAVEAFLETIQRAAERELHAIRSKRNDTGERIREAEELGHGILDLIEDLPDDAKDFGGSVGEQVEAILATIHRTGRVTTKQYDALANMDTGVRTWLHE